MRKLPNRASGNFVGGGAGGEIAEQHGARTATDLYLQQAIVDGETIDVWPGESKAPRTSRRGRHRKLPGMICGWKVLERSPTGDVYGPRLYDGAKEGQVNEVSYMSPKAGADKTWVPKASFVTAVAGLGCGVGYYK
jgi:hypothetical protein